MEQQAGPGMLHASPEQAELLQERQVIEKEPSSLFSRLLCYVLQLSFVQNLLKVLQKVSVWVGFVVPVEIIVSKFQPTQSPNRPGRLAKKRRGRLARLLSSIIPTRLQNILGYLPADWGQRNMPKEVGETLINPSNKANKRKRDDVALEEQESWVVVLEKDLLEDDPEDVTYEPSEVETDSEEYRSQNDTETDLEFEEQEGTIVLKESSNLQVEDLQAENRGCNSPEVQGVSRKRELEVSAVSSSGEDAPNATSSGTEDAQKSQPESDGDGSSQEQGSNAHHDGSSDLLQNEDKQEL